MDRVEDLELQEGPSDKRWQAPPVIEEQLQEAEQSQQEVVSWATLRRRLASMPKRGELPLQGKNQRSSGRGGDGVEVGATIQHNAQ